VERIVYLKQRPYSPRLIILHETLKKHSERVSIKGDKELIQTMIPLDLLQASKGPKKDLKGRSMKAL